MQKFTRYAEEQGRSPNECSISRALHLRSVVSGPQEVCRDSREYLGIGDVSGVKVSRTCSKQKDKLVYEVETEEKEESLQAVTVLVP